jgi:hypothetical protein
VIPALQAEGRAWRSNPSWYVVASSDRTNPPELERFVAERMSATTFEVDSGHVQMLSHPDLALDVIRHSQPAIGALFGKLAHSTSYEDFRALVQQAWGSAGLMRFMQRDLRHRACSPPASPATPRRGRI